LNFINKRFASRFSSALLVVLADYFLVLSSCIIAGRVISESALGAMNLLMPCFAIAAFFQYLTASGAFALYSKALRRGEEEQAARLACTGLIATTVVSLAIVFLFSLFAPGYAAVMNPDAATYCYASEYWSWYLPGVVFSGVEIMLFFLVFAKGGERTCLYSYFIQFAVQVVASYWLCRRYGTRGISMGAVIGYLCGILILLQGLVGSAGIRLKASFELMPLVRSFRTSFGDSWIWLVHAVLFFALTKYIIAAWDSESLPVLAVVFCVIRITGLFGGIGIALKSVDEKQRFFRTASSLAFGIMGFLVICFFVAPEPLISLFGIEDFELIEGSKVAARVTVIGLVICTLIAFVPLWLRARRAGIPEAPLNYLQSYILSRLHEEGDPAHMFNLVKLFRLRKGVDLERLSEALCESARTHAAIMTVLRKDVDGEIVQRQELSPEAICCPIVKGDERELLESRGSLVTEFGALGKPMLNAAIFDCGERAYLLSDFHHFICDGYSFPLILEGARKIYNGETLEKDDYYGVLEKRRAKSSSSMAEASRAFMHEFLSNPLFTRLPKDDFHGPSSYGVSEVSLTIPSDFENFLAARRVTRHHVFMAATALALYRLTGGNSILIDWVFHGRVSKDELKTVGAFMVDLPLVIDNMSDLTAGDVLSRVKQATFNGIKNTACIRSVEDVNPDGRDRLTFIYQDEWGELMTSGPVREDGPYAWMIEETYSITAPVSRTENPFNVEIMEHRDGTRLEIEYDAGRYSEATVRRYVELFKEEFSRILGGDSGINK